MAKYLDRICPRCKGYLGIVIPTPPRKTTELAVNGFCVDCGYRAPFRKVILGKRFFSAVHAAHRKILPFKSV